VSHPLVTL